MATIVTTTVKPSGGDYTSLSAWEAGQQGNLVTLDQVQVADCYAMSDTASVVIAGWTTDATRYIQIQTPSSERHDGKWNTGKYRLEVTDQDALAVNEDYVRIDGLQTATSGTTAGISEVRFSFISATSDNHLSNTIIKGNGTYSDGLAVASSSAGNLKVFNCIIYGAKRSFFGGIRYLGAGTTLYVYNSTLYDNYFGINRGNGTVIAKNVLAYNNTTNKDFEGTFDASSDYNFSKDDTAPGANSIHGDTDGKTPDFVDAGAFDFHLQATSDAIGVGTDDPGSGLFSDDIDGETRSSIWDIGADEFVSGGGSALLKIYNEAVNSTSANQRLMAMNRPVVETQSLTEGTQRRGSLLRALGETVSIAGAALRRSSLVRLANSALDISESTLKSISALLVRVINGTVQAAEGAARRLFLSRHAGEELAVTEGVGKRGFLRRILNGSVAITEGVLKASSLVRTLGETVSLAGAAIKRSSLVRLIASTVQAAESTGTVRGFVRVVSEAMSVAEGVVRGALAALGTLSDNLSVVFRTVRRGVSSISRKRGALSRSHKRGVKS